jgi:hypothetical protein
MSWDIFAQDIPAEAITVSDIPVDFVPRPIGTRTDIIAAIQDIIPFADVSDPYWVRVRSPELDLEIGLGKHEPLMGFAFHVRGGDLAPGAIAAVLTKLNLRAFDPGSDSGIFDVASAAGSLERWRRYRNLVLVRANT